jgi:hypothetical protein
MVNQYVMIYYFVIYTLNDNISKTIIGQHFFAFKQ